MFAYARGRAIDALRPPGYNAGLRFISLQRAAAGPPRCGKVEGVVLKYLTRVALSLVAVCLGMVLMVQSVAYFIWLLPDVGGETLAEIRQAEVAWAADEVQFEAVGHHRVEEWPADRERRFNEAPSLRRRVEAGELPPVDERVPAEPLVVVPPEQHGPYGGRWRRYDVDQNSHIVNMLFRLGNESLIRWDAGGDRLIPNIARAWESSEDGREHTIHLRRGIRWSDGHPFTVDDILFWYEDVVKHASYRGSVPRDFMRGGEPMELEKVDDHTLIFRFKEPNPMLPEELASRDDYMQMLQFPKHYLTQFHVDYTSEEQLREHLREGNFPSPRALLDEKHGYNNNECPRLWAWVPVRDPTTQRWVFDRNPYYWKVDDEGNQLPYIDELSFEMFNSEMINMRFMAGDVGMQARRVEFDNYALFKRNTVANNFRVLEWEQGGGGELAIAFNVNRDGDPFLRQLYSDRRFRIAMSHAIDRDEINEVQYLGMGVPRQMAPPRGSPYYSAAYESAYIEHDPERANALLDELGLVERSPDGFRRRPDGRPLQIFIDITSAIGAEQAIRLVAAQWRAVGVDAQMRMLSGGLLSRRQMAAQHDVVVWWGENEKNPIMDPRWFAPVHMGSNWAPRYRMWYNLEGESGEEPSGAIMQAIELWGEIQVEPDAERRVELWQEINELNRENLWVIGLIGEVPQLVLKHNSFRNVPDRAIYGFIYRSPGVTAPEIYAIEGSE